MGPGQKREQFEFSEEFPAMDSYSANVRCEAKEAAIKPSSHFRWNEGS